MTAVLAPLLGGTWLPFSAVAGAGDRVFLPVERRRTGRCGLTRTSGHDLAGLRGRGADLRAGVVRLLYVILRLQGVLPLNPTHAPRHVADTSFNTAISSSPAPTGRRTRARPRRATGRHGRAVVAQFTAAAVGLAVALAVVRGIAGSARRIGNLGGLHPVAGPVSSRCRSSARSPGSARAWCRTSAASASPATRPAAASRSPADRSRRWRSSSCSAPTAAACTARAAHTRSRTHRFHQHVRPAAGDRGAVRDHLHVGRLIGRPGRGWRSSR